MHQVVRCGTEKIKRGTELEAPRESYRRLGEPPLYPRLRAWLVPNSLFIDLVEDSPNQQVTAIKEEDLNENLRFYILDYLH